MISGVRRCPMVVVGGVGGGPWAAAVDGGG